MKRFRLSQFLIFNFLIFKRLRIKNYDLKIAGSQNQRGVIALITTIVVSLLLIVITASGIALMGSELRQASDYDQSVKAYFAAEAGVEDALAVLKRNGTDYANTINTYWADPDSCNYSIVPAGISSILDDNNQISYSCQIVSTKDNNVTGSLDKEAATQIDLNGISNTFRRLRLSWNQINSTDPSGWNPTQFPAGSKFPKGDQWADSSGKQFPAVMEVSVISYPTPGPGVTFNNNPRPDPNGIYKDSVGLRPDNSGGNSAAIDAAPSSQPVVINCDGDVDYNCSVTLTGFVNSRTYLINLHTRYSPTHYKVEALGSAPGNTALDIPNAQLVIDVTGKAGNVFRRVQAKAPLSPQTGFPTFVLLADDAVCKLLDVSRTTDKANTENPALNAGCGQ